MTTTYRARCGAAVVKDVPPGEFRTVRERLADYIEAQAPPPAPNGNVSRFNPFHLAANRVRLWQPETVDAATQFVKLPGDRRYRIEVAPDLEAELELKMFGTDGA